MGRCHVVTGSRQKLPGNNWQWKRVLSFEGKEQQESCYASTDNVGRSCRDRYRRRRLLVSPYALVVSACAGGRVRTRETEVGLSFAQIKLGHRQGAGITEPN
jgi:hypothetical protein